MLGNEPKSPTSDSGDAEGRDAGEVCPRSIVEAMLFVGRPDGRALSARELAAAMRGVSPKEVDAVVGELNETYREHDAPIEIVNGAKGYRMELREEFGGIRDRYLDRNRQAKLSTVAIEVLSLVAYHQPVTLDRVNELRRSASGKVMNALVQRGLIRMERKPDRPRKPDYFTTERFLKVFRLADLDELPRSSEFDAA